MSTNRRPGWPQLPEPEMPRVPLAAKVGAALALLSSLALVGVAVWAVIKLVNHFTA